MDKEELKKAMLQAQSTQLDLVRAHEELSNTVIEGLSKDGKVKITMYAQGDFRKVEIDPSTLVEGIHCVERGVLEALNDCVHKASELMQNRLTEISKQIGL